MTDKDSIIETLLTQNCILDAQIAKLSKNLARLEEIELSESPNRSIALTQIQIPTSQTNLTHTNRTVDKAIDYVFKLAQTEAKFRSYRKT
jgi:hypothetical protein